GSCRSSSVGESTRLISAGSTVRVRPPAPVSGRGRGGEAGRTVGAESPSPRRPAPPAWPARSAPGPMDLLERVRRTIRRHGLSVPETRVVVGLSGGSDSVALAHLLRQLDEARELQLAGLAHFNHQLRPEASADEQFCAE